MGRIWRIVGIVSPNPLEIQVKFKRWFACLVMFLSGTVLPAWATESASHADPAMELERMDQRTPVPLSPHMALHQKQNMRDHLEAIQAIVAGLAKQDFPAIEAAAARMGFSKEMEGMCQRMGAGAPGFSDRAIKFHKTADEIAVYARKKDEKGVLDSLNRTLAQCVSCHATYRQQIVAAGTSSTLIERLKSSK